VLKVCGEGLRRAKDEETPGYSSASAGEVPAAASRGRPSGKPQSMWFIITCTQRRKPPHPNVHTSPSPFWTASRVARPIRAVYPTGSARTSNSAGRT
jgi:hypothetical protein